MYYRNFAKSLPKSICISPNKIQKGGDSADFCIFCKTCVIFLHFVLFIFKYNFFIRSAITYIEMQISRNSIMKIFILFLYSSIVPILILYLGILLCLKIIFFGLSSLSPYNVDSIKINLQKIIKLRSYEPRTVVELFRVTRITYSGQDTYKGIDGYRFTINENTFRYETEFPENDCFCVQQTLDENGASSCFLNGLIDLKPCIGAPILLSFPHFLYADDYYREAIEGVDEPDESIHKIYLLVEPNTGTPLEGKKRVQFNVVLRPVSYLAFSEDLPKVVLPMFWVDEGVSLPQKYVDELNDKYFNVLNVASGVKYGMIAVSLAAVVTASGFLIRKQFFTG